MGDRANIYIRDDYELDKGVYLYTHWSGTDLPETLRTALAKNWRWNDPAYLARIIFDVMTEDAHGDETGFGISATIPDGDDRILDVDCTSRTVTQRGLGHPIPFVDYIRQERSWS